MKWSEPDFRDREIYQSEQVITWEDLPWVEIKDPKIHYPIIK